jgi:hypothetical protein
MVETLISILVMTVILGLNQLFFNHVNKRIWYSLRVSEYLIYGSAIFGSLWLIVFVFVGMIVIRIADIALFEGGSPVAAFLDRYICGAPLEENNNG